MTIDRRTLGGALFGGAGLMAAGLPGPAIAAPRTGFLRAEGQRIVEADGSTARLNGVAFGNRVWIDDRIPVLHHGPEDFARVAAMGMTLVRFYLNHLTLADPARPGVYRDDGWDWIDRNIAWARAAGVRLSLNLHVPPGGFQSQGDGGALWEQPVFQDRTVALWRAIAARYADEPVVIGYDLVNEPVVTRDKAQWQGLAQRIARAIREVDTNHLVIVERVNAIGRDWSNDADQNFVKIDDPNLVYTFHSYDPFDFTHQNAAYLPEMVGKFATYPDPARGWTKDGLRGMLAPTLAWGNRNGVPLYCGEWGANFNGFEMDRGGIAFVADMLDVLLEAGMPFTYHVYHENTFGIYRGDDALDLAYRNQPLIDLFTRRLNA